MHGLKYRSLFPLPPRRQKVQTISSRFQSSHLVSLWRGSLLEQWCKSDLSSYIRLGKERVMVTIGHILDTGNSFKANSIMIITIVCCNIIINNILCPLLVWTPQWLLSSMRISFSKCPPPCRVGSFTAWPSTAPPFCMMSTGTHSPCGPEMSLPWYGNSVFCHCSVYIYNREVLCVAIPPPC